MHLAQVNNRFMLLGDMCSPGTGFFHSCMHALDRGFCFLGADPQQRLAMSEEAAAAVELDAALEKASHSSTHKAFSGSARPETNGLHGASKRSSHQEKADAASKVGGDTLWCAAVFGVGGWCCHPQRSLMGRGGEHITIGDCTRCCCSSQG